MRKHLFLIPLLILSACAPADYRYLKREKIEDTRVVTGYFTLILYGNRHGDDFETVAILDREDDTYVFTPYASPFNYKIKRNLKGQDALAEAFRFVRQHESFKGARISMLSHSRDNLLGFEVRPFYRDTRFGFSDVLNVGYQVEDTAVRVFVTLKSFAEEHFQKDDFGRD